jgi:hypothetical protein
MTQCLFLFGQLTTTVANPLRRGSARLTSSAPLRAPLLIPPPTPAQRRRRPSPLQFHWPGPETLPSPGAF